MTEKIWDTTDTIREVMQIFENRYFSCDFMSVWWKDMRSYAKPSFYPHDEAPWLRKCRKIAVLQGFQNLAKTDLRHIYDKWKNEDTLWP